MISSYGEPSISGALLVIGGCVAATICLVIGGFFLEWSTERLREKHVSRYEAAIDNWKKTREEFSNLTMTMLLDNISVELVANTSVDALHDSQNEVPLPEHRPLKYTGVFPSGVLSAGVLPAPTNSSQRAVFGREVEVHLDIDGSRLELGSYALSKASAHFEQKGVYGRCREQLGEQVGQLCWVYSQLSGACVQIRRELDGQRWQVMSKNNSGCVLKKGSWESAVYSPVSLDEIRGRTVPVATIALEVRSEHDPYFDAMEITKGSLNFGMPALEERVTGILLLVMGLVLCCLPQGALCRWALCAYLKRRKRNYRRSLPPLRTGPQRTPAETVGMKYAVGEASDDEFQVK